MMKQISFLIAFLVASPAFAASGPFFSLKNTNFIVLLAFVLFIGVLFYFNVPKLLGGMLDKRAESIRSELEEARNLREEAQSILASYERRQKEVQEQADRIVESARKEAEAEAIKARAALEVTVARRFAAAEEQIASAQSRAERAVREKAIEVAVSAARNVIASQMTAARARTLIDAATGEVESKLH